MTTHPTPEQLKAVADQISNTVADEGQLVQTGWLGFAKACMPKGAPDEQVHAMRVSFFSGASHLFASMMVILDPTQQPVERDANRMALIYAELEAFQKSFQPKVDKDSLDS